MKKLIGAVIGVAMAAPGLIFYSRTPYQVEAWEHGFKTSRVIATRYTNKFMGYNIGFEFPKDIYNADRAEVSDFMEANGGWIYQGGGYPGAIAYVKFKDVTDQESANKKLKAILPPLSQLMADMSAGRKVVIEKPKASSP